MALQDIDGMKNNQGVTVEVTDSSPGEGYAEAAITPGAVVVRGTAAGQIIEASADAIGPLGWAYENFGTGAVAPTALTTLRTDHPINSRVRYETSPGSKFMGIIDGSVTNVTKGMALKTAAGGTLVAIVAADSPAVACARYRGETAITAAATRGMCQWGA